MNRGHRVTLVTHCAYETRVKSKFLDFVALDSPEEYQNFLRDQELLNAPQGIPEFLRRHCLLRALAEYRLVSQLCARKDSMIVTRDLFDLVPRLVAEKLQLPVRWIFGNPSQVATWSLREQLFSRLLQPEINQIRFKLDLPSLSPADLGVSYPTLGVGLWPEWFAEFNESCPIPVVPVGFIREDDAAEADLPPAIKDILNCGKPTVLISAGTGNYISSEFYRVATKACELLDFAAIAVMQHANQLPNDCSPCVSWIGMLPFRQLMKRVQVVIHHGGLGTLACALEAGVPQLVLPKGADRPDNAERLQGLGVAESLAPLKWQPEPIAEALSRLANSPLVAERCKVIADRLRGEDGSAAACEVLERRG